MVNKISPEPVLSRRVSSFPAVAQKCTLGCLSDKVTDTGGWFSEMEPSVCSMRWSCELPHGTASGLVDVALRRWEV